MIGTVALGILVPFIGTSLGAAMVFLLKKEINPKIQKLLLGFASGVMIAASIWSLILPSVELAKEAIRHYNVKTGKNDLAGGK